MAILIDGYNLLHVTGIFGRGVGPGSLERSRRGLLNFVAEVVDDKELPHTTVVFDAKEAPPGLPRTWTHRGIVVHFAAQFEEADDLLEELIRTDPTPRKLLVVSSDHRIQRAARRRRAAAVDSDVWYDEALRRRSDSQRLTARDVKPDPPASASEVEHWLAEFGLEPAPRPLPPKDESEAGEGGAAKPADRNVAEANQPTKPAKPDKAKRRGRTRRKPRQLPDDVANPFPPGYGEDLLEP